MTAPAATKRVHVIQGEYRIAREPDVVLTTILGSCIAACLRDPAAGVGGMNHFLLPGTNTSCAQGAAAARYGVYLMELLINELLKNGARRDNLEAKIFGGAQTMSSFSNVGQQNADFAKQFLADEGIRIVNASTGGAHGRKLEYWPVSGRARQYALNNQDLLRSAEIERPRVPPPPIDNSVEFF